MLRLFECLSYEKGCRFLARPGVFSPAATVIMVSLRLVLRVPGDVDPPRHPHLALLEHIIDKALQRGDASWPPAQPAMADRQYLEITGAFGILWMDLQRLRDFVSAIGNKG
ncbi:MAG: hypothetical protein PHE55_19840 [Methylococcaceae bacterium]|nr:hypothetical protein [Methylococcaceae bacterium]